jgi:hypothetical protein
MRWSSLTAERSCLALAEPWPLRARVGKLHAGVPLHPVRVVELGCENFLSHLKADLRAASTA